MQKSIITMLIIKATWKWNKDSGLPLCICWGCVPAEHADRDPRQQRTPHYTRHTPAGWAQGTLKKKTTSREMRTLNSYQMYTILKLFYGLSFHNRSLLCHMMKRQKKIITMPFSSTLKNNAIIYKSVPTCDFSFMKNRAKEKLYIFTKLRH